MCSSPSPSQKIKHALASAESTREEGFFSPLNPICADALACSMARLCLTTAHPLIPPNSSTRLCCHCCGQFLHRHTSTSLQDAKEKLISAAKIPSQLLREPDLMEIILWQLKDHLCDLMMDQHCMFSILTIFQASSTHHITQILDLAIQNEDKLKEVCMHTHGSVVIQKLLEHLKTPVQICEAMFAMKRMSVRLSKNMNGGHVIYHCFNLFSPALTRVSHPPSILLPSVTPKFHIYFPDSLSFSYLVLHLSPSQFIIDEVAENCVEIATDKSGCAVLQTCLHHAKDNTMKRLLEEIVSHYVVKMKIPDINQEIMLKLQGRYAQLSMNKHASNVVEHLLEFSEEKDAVIIIQELMQNQNILCIMQDPYGNYVVQRALQNCKVTQLNIYPFCNSESMQLAGCIK
ncbi:unnamed protein product [Sphenostylis stenocarpa]|uniref:PUM-HD domain-containing protein n=1 Tax=Sphenostylis stenocarpa TaxID=92480 RepID=A0AA86S0U5_9FABA|nr:unnamed protein product [Sphenostylis stenocarpa]